MRGMPFDLQGKGVLEVAAAVAAAEETLWRSTTICGDIDSSSCIDKKGGVEPRSVLDHRRSPSPPTSTSTLSSSLGGGGTDSTGVAAVSDNTTLHHKWPPRSQDTTSSAAAEEEAPGSSSVGGGRKDDWASELQPIAAGALEIDLMGGKCGGGGLGIMEDWESVLSEAPTASAAAAASSPGGHEQSFLRWIMGDIDDPSAAAAMVVGMKPPPPLQQQHHHYHHQLTPPQGPLEFEGGGGFGFGLGLAADPFFGFEPIGGGMGGGMAASSTVVVPPLPCSVPSPGGFPPASGNNNNGSSHNRIPLLPPSPGMQSGLKIPSFSNSSNPNLIFSPLPPPANSVPLPLSLPQGMFFQDPPMEEKPQFFGPNLLMNQQQVHTPPSNQTFFLPLPPYAQADQHQQHFPLPPHTKRHHPIVDSSSCQIPLKHPFSDSGQDIFQRRQQQQPQQQQEQALVEQLFEAAKQVEAGNFVNAQQILARLNHQLFPVGKPLLRSAFYFKEVIRYIVNNNLNTHPSSPPLTLPNPSAPATHLDVVFKLSAYKTFSEMSPILQFTNFTGTQALLEELDGCDRIHIIEFDIGVGGQWSSFMQELAQRRCGAAAATPSLRITAFASLSSSHPLELSLTRENLTDFANDLNIPFEFNVLSIDPFDAESILNVLSGSDEAIAVNLPVGSAYPTVSTLLHLVKRLHPKIVFSVDHGCDRSDLSFSDHFLHALKSSTLLLDSIDAAGINPDEASKMERWLLQPRIESSMLGCHRAAEKMLPWRTLFVSAGFIPVPFSNPTETQAEYLLKRIQVRGFHVEKRQSSLFLCWQHGELVSVSAWRC